jgi:hypothetical protein
MTRSPIVNRISHRNPPALTNGSRRCHLRTRLTRVSSRHPRRLWKRVRRPVYAPNANSLYQAIGRLLPLTSDHGEEPCPKALLSVANKPMIDYTLSWVEQSGIKGITTRTLDVGHLVNTFFVRPSRCTAHLPYNSSSRDISSHPFSCLCLSFLSPHRSTNVRRVTGFQCRNMYHPTSFF